MDKAKLTNIDTGEVVEFMFRPKEYQFAKSNGWEPPKIIGLNMGPPKFTGGSPIKITLELFFDTYEEKTDVRTRTELLWKMMKITPGRKDPNTKKGSPPQVQFSWGQVWTFTAVITELSQKFTLFLPDGTPVRCTMSVALLQAKEEGRYTSQNPTSGSLDEATVHVVTEGETLDWIAYNAYGNPNSWRHLAEVNHLDDPSRIRPGQRLLIVPTS